MLQCHAWGGSICFCKNFLGSVGHLYQCLLSHRFAVFLLINSPITSTSSHRSPWKSTYIFQQGQQSPAVPSNNPLSVRAFFFLFPPRHHTGVFGVVSWRFGCRDRRAFAGANTALIDLCRMRVMSNNHPLCCCQTPDSLLAVVRSVSLSFRSIDTQRQCYDDSFCSSLHVNRVRWFQRRTDPLA